MQSYSLTVDKFLDHAAKWFPDTEVVEANSGEVIRRAGYGELRWRSNRLSGALFSLGLAPGQSVGTLAWNTQHHLELYYAAMSAGLICHTLNPRLTPQQLAAMVNEAEDHVLAVSANLLPLAAKVIAQCPVVRQVIILDEDRGKTLDVECAETWTLENLLEQHGRTVTWGEFSEDAPAGLCYTSGTTGGPKGVIYSHRSNYLHTLRALQADAMAITANDVVLVAVPMFHANAWGLPFAAPAVGAKLVLPGRHMDGASLAALMREEGVTIGVGVQTVWLSVVDYLDETGGDPPPNLDRIIIGGASCPDNLIRRMEQGLSARVQTSWGMTELSPLGTISPPFSRNATASGRPVMGVDLKLTDASGVALPEQRGVVGHLWVKGASVIDRYYKADSDCRDAEGFFNTGDLAMIDKSGNLAIRGRSKDLIKSGGEWINPAEIETIVGRDSSVSLVAVISTPHDKWGERPLLIVQPRPGATVEGQTLVDSLRGKVADWWIPERVAQIEAMPLSGSGKIDKNQLRADFEAGKIVGEPVA
jgi:fatty-acyl-CoA synthase